MAVRMVNAIPKTNAGVVGFGDICSPHGSSTLVPVPVLVPVLPFRGANRERCVSCFTLRIIVILMETIKDLYINVHRLRLPLREPSVSDSGPILRLYSRL